MHKDIIQFLPKISGTFRTNTLLSNLTWFKVGGAAEIIFKPKNSEDLSYFLSNFDKKIPLNILGLCSNVIVRDGGIPGVTIRLGSGFNNIEIRDNIVSIGCAAGDYNTAMFLAAQGLSGLEFLIGIPGSIGGAIAMNAGCYGSETSDYIESVEAIRKLDGKIYNLSKKDLNMSYRTSPLKDEFIFTNARFKLKEATNKDKIREELKQITETRSLSQPTKERTGGSTFKNPEDKKAWELIDKSGMRGYKIGGAQVSEKHCNFLINTGNATATDLEDLGDLVQKKVYAKTKTSLEWEIVRMGIK